MKEIKITKKELSSNFDPELAWNGGGYAQPKIDGEIREGEDVLLKFYIDDTSCGEFGSRYDVSFESSREELSGRYSTNEIDFGGELKDESTLRWNSELDEIRDAFYKATGFWFLMAEELPTEEDEGEEDY